LSAGVALGEDSWEFPLRDLGSVYVYAPPDFIGVMNAMIALLSPSKKIIDSSFVDVLIGCFISSLVPGMAVLRAAPPEGMPSPDDTWKLPTRDAMNANTVTVITAPAGGATSVFGSDMARVLDDGNIRVLPVLGKGPVRNVVYILYLKAIDMGMVVSDVPEFYRLQYKIPDITRS
jgi:hypothetical protein